MNDYQLGRAARIRNLTLAAALVLAGALAVSMASPALSASPSPGGTAAALTSALRAVPAVEVCGQGAALVRPSSMVLTCADNGELAEHLDWSSWTRTRATATAIVTWRACSALCADDSRWDRTSADVTLTDPVAKPGTRVLFTRLELHVTGPTPRGFLRDLAFDEAPMVSPAPRPLRPGKRPSPLALAAPSGTLGYAQIEGFWRDAGGPASPAGNFTDDQIAAAITGAESSFLPGIIQPGVNYCDAGSDRAGWGLWQLTCGNSVPQFGTNFQLLDPWNNAEAAVSKYDADVAAGFNGFDPWSTYTDGAYASFLQHTAADTQLSDPGEYQQINSTPAGTPSSPPPDPGSTFGPPMPGVVGEVVLRANTGHLFTYDPSTNGHVDANLGMAAGTSPAIAAGSGGFEVALQANTGHLFIYNPQTSGHVDAGLGMAAGTSPAIAAAPGGGFEVAFQANTGHLFIYNPQTNSHVDTGLGMAAGTSPSIAGSEVAFQANTGHLLTYDPATNGHVDAGLGMAAGTSPSIAGSGVAFQANTGHLFIYDPSTNGHVDAGLGMAAGTSPSIAGSGVAFQANTGHLFIYDPSTNGHVDAGLGMAAGTSPSIAGSEVAFQANTGHLFTYDPATNGHVDAGLGMTAGTSPSMSN